MATVISKMDVQHAFGRLQVAVECAIKLVGTTAPEMDRLSREAEALQGYAHIEAWAAAREVLDGMHTRRVQAQILERAARERRSAISTLIDDEVLVARAMVVESIRQQAEAVERGKLIDDEAGD